MLRCQCPSVRLWRLWIVVTGCNGSRIPLHAWIDECLCYLLTTPHPDRRMGWCRDFWWKRGVIISRYPNHCLGPLVYLINLFILCQVAVWQLISKSHLIWFEAWLKRLSIWSQPNYLSTISYRVVHAWSTKLFCDGFVEVPLYRISKYSSMYVSGNEGRQRALDGGGSVGDTLHCDCKKNGWSTTQRQRRRLGQTPDVAHHSPTQRACVIIIHYIRSHEINVAVSYYRPITSETAEITRLIVNQLSSRRGVVSDARNKIP